MEPLQGRTTRRLGGGEESRGKHPARTVESQDDGHGQTEIPTLNLHLLNFWASRLKDLLREKQNHTTRNQVQSIVGESHQDLQTSQLTEVEVSLRVF